MICTFVVPVVATTFCHAISKQSNVFSIRVDSLLVAQTPLLDSSAVIYYSLNLFYTLGMSLSAGCKKSRHALPNRLSVNLPSKVQALPQGWMQVTDGLQWCFYNTVAKVAQWPPPKSQAVGASPAVKPVDTKAAANLIDSIKEYQRTGYKGVFLFIVIIFTVLGTCEKGTRNI